MPKALYFMHLPVFFFTDTGLTQLEIVYDSIDSNAFYDDDDGLSLRRTLAEF